MRLFLALMALTIVVGCGDEQGSAAQSPSLEGPPWELVSGIDVSDWQPVAPSALFANGHMSGFDGCNRYRGLALLTATGRSSRPTARHPDRRPRRRFGAVRLDRRRAQLGCKAWRRCRRRSDSALLNGVETFAGRYEDHHARLPADAAVAKGSRKN